MIKKDVNVFTLINDCTLITTSAKRVLFFAKFAVRLELYYSPKLSMFYEDDFIKVVGNRKLGVARTKEKMRYLKNKQPSKKVTLRFSFNI